LPKRVKAERYRLFNEGMKRGEAMIRSYSYHNSLPSPLMKGRGIKGEGLVNNLIRRVYK